jgi:hypothetical protein
MAAATTASCTAPVPTAATLGAAATAATALSKAAIAGAVAAISARVRVATVTTAPWSARRHPGTYTARTQLGGFQPLPLLGTERRPEVVPSVAVSHA